MLLGYRFWSSLLFSFQRESLGSASPNIRGATSGPKLGAYPRRQRRLLRMLCCRYAPPPPSLGPSHPLVPCWLSWTLQITKVGRAQILSPSISPHLPLSEELTGVCDVCETVRKLPTSPQPLCGSHQMVFAVNLGPILIFNHLLQSSIQIARSSTGAREVLEGEVSH